MKHFFSILLLSTSLLGNESKPAAVLQQQAQQLGQSGISTVFELRPSWESRSGKVFGEDLVDFGYVFNDDTRVSYEQGFRHNIYGDSADPGGPLNLQAQDGFFKARLNNLLVSRNDRWSFDLEPQLYLPTNAVERDCGMIGAIRGYAILNYKPSPFVTLSALEAPVFYGYSQAGGTRDDELSANPLVENRFTLQAGLSFFDNKLNVTLPVILHTTRHRNFTSEAVLNDRWAHFLWVKPEIFYEVARGMFLGAGYYSDNLIADDFSDTAFGGGFENGITQLILRTSL